VGLALLLSAGGAMAFTGFDTHGSRTQSINQNVDLDEDDVLAALALGGGSASIGDIADIHRSVRTSEDLSRNVDLDTNDVLAALAFGHGFGGAGLGTSDAILGGNLGTSGLGTLGGSETSGFGTLGGLGIGDFNDFSRVSVDQRHNVDLDTNDVLLALALS
jgi:hypothetical protein